MTNYGYSFLILGACLSMSCGTGKTRAANNVSQLQSTADILTLTKRSDGNFDVTCRDGTREVRSQRDLDTGNLCQPIPTPIVTPAPTPTIDDPYDARSCQGQPLTSSEAFSKFQFPNNVSVDLGKSELYIRSRACLSVDGCAAWNQTPSWSSDSVNEYNNIFDVLDAEYTAPNSESGAHINALNNSLITRPMDLHIQLIQNKPALQLFGFGSPIPISSEFDFNGSSSFNTIPSSDESLGNLRYRTFGLIRDSSLKGFGLLTRQMSGVSRSEPFETMKNAVRQGNFVGVVNQRCTRYSAKNIIPMTYKNGNTGTLEQEYAVLFRY